MPSSIVTVQLGQCGNQIGAGLFSQLATDATTPPKFTSANTLENIEYKNEVLERFFASTKSGNYEARAVLVDMEPKAIVKTREIANKSDLWRYPLKSEYVQKKGSGNNWALGYHGYGQLASDHVTELCRREVEKCDAFAGFLILMSLAGGTGSGLGAHLTYSLKDDNEHAFMVHNTVWPYASGEVILQNYNALLTLSHLQQSSDLILGQQNTQLHAICQKLLALNQVSIDDINQLICQQLASILQPSLNESNQPNDPYFDLISQIVPHPSYKMASTRSVPHISERSKDFSTFRWPGILGNMRQMLIADACMEEGMNWEVKCDANTRFNKSLSNILVLRGHELQEADTKSFKEKLLYSTILPTDQSFQLWSNRRCINNLDKCATLCSNSQSFVKPLHNMISKSWQMFNARAYVHQYEKYGLTQEDFIDSFGMVEQMQQDYSRL